MFTKRSKKKPLLLVGSVAAGIAAAVLGAKFLPVPEKYSQLIFWLILFGVTFLAAAIARRTGRR